MMKRRAFLLLMVLLVVSGVSLTAVSLSESMLMSYEETLLTNRAIQARCAADSGVAAVRLFLANTKQGRIDSGGVWDNPTYFQAANIVPDADPRELCNFSVIAPNIDEQGYYASARYGLQNESARLNLNALVTIDKIMGSASGLSAALGAASPGLASLGMPSDLAGSAESAASSGGVGQQLLMGLPGMTEDIADAILDFMDEDDEPRTYGAESEYYSQLPTPFSAANGPLLSVDELLLVRGVTPQHLFGLDQNRNGVLDSFELAALGPLAAGASTPNGFIDPNTQQVMPQLGWAQYLTLYSREKNVDAEGIPRININGTDLTQLQTDLTSALGNEDWASFILAYRALGPGDPNATGGSGAGGQGGGGQGGRGGQNGGPGGGQGGPGDGKGDGPGGRRGDGPGDRRVDGPGDGRGGGPGGPGNGGPGDGGRGRDGAGPGGGQGNRPGQGQQDQNGPQRGGQGGGARPAGRTGSIIETGISDYVYLDPFQRIPSGFMVAFQGPRGNNQGGNDRGGNNQGGNDRGAGQGGAGGPGNGRPGGAGSGPGGGGPGNGGPGGGRGGDGKGGDGKGGDGRGGDGRDRDGKGGDGRDRDGKGGDGKGGRGGDGKGGPGGGPGGNNGGKGGSGGTTGAKQMPWTSDAVKIDLTAQPKGQFNQLLDLIGATITVNQGNQSVTYKSPFQNNPLEMAMFLPLLMDKLTTVDGPIIPGRININEAPFEIVSGIPGMTPELVEQLMAARSELNDSENRKFETWPMVEGYVTLEQMRSLLPLVTGGGDVYRAQVVGYYEQGAAFARVEVVIDAAEQLPLVVSYRRMDHLGRGFSNATLGQRSMGLPMAGQ